MFWSLFWRYKIILTAIGVVLMIALTFTGLPDDAREDEQLRQLLANGVTVPATITDGWNENHFPVITYTFQYTDAAGKSAPHKGSSYIPEDYFKTLAKGQTIKIKYLKTDPEFTRIVGYEGSPDTAPNSYNLLVLGIAGAVTLVVILIMPSSRKLIMQDFDVTSESSPQEKNLTTALLDKLEPYTPEILSRLKANEPLDKVAIDIAVQAGVKPQDVKLYVSELARVARKKRQTKTV